MTAEQLLDFLMTQTFADFYKDELEDYITGEGSQSKEDIIGNLKELMNK